MNHFLFSIYKRIFLSSLFIWMCVGVLVKILIAYNLESGIESFLMIGGILSISSPLAYITGAKTSLFLRLYAKTVLDFWKNMLKINMVIIFCNVLFITVIGQVFGRYVDLKPGSQNILHVIWIVVVSFIISTAISLLIHDPRRNQILVQKFHLMTLGVLGYFLGIAAMGFLFVQSRLLGYFCLSTSVFLLTLFKNPLFKSSIYPENRRKVMGFGMAVIFMIFAASSFVGMQFEDTRDSLLSEIGPDFFENPIYKINTDFNSVETIDEWLLAYKRKHDSVDVNEVILALNRLNEFCPSKPSDTPLTLVCSGAYGQNGLDLLFHRAWSETDLLKMLKSGSPYAELLGLVEARRLPKPLSAPMANAIEEFTRFPGKTSAVASRTLYLQKPHSAVGLNLFIYKKPPEE